MPRLLRSADYNRLIDSDLLDQIIDVEQTLLDTEQSAQSEMSSYLTQRYITSQIFTDTTTFDSGSTYNAKNLVSYTENPFSSTTAYSAGQRVSYNGSIYSAVTSSSGITPTVLSAWTFVVADQQLFYANTPGNVFDVNTSYQIGSIVFYNNVFYQALKNIQGIYPGQSSNLELRYITPGISSFYPSPSILPDADTADWSAGTAYSFTGIYPDNTAYWTKGDNRNQQIVMYLIDIILYHLPFKD